MIASLFCDSPRGRGRRAENHKLSPCGRYNFTFRMDSVFLNRARTHGLDDALLLVARRERSRLSPYFPALSLGAGTRLASSRAGEVLSFHVTHHSVCCAGRAGPAHTHTDHSEYARSEGKGAGRVVRQCVRVYVASCHTRNTHQDNTSARHLYLYPPPQAHTHAPPLPSLSATQMRVNTWQRHLLWSRRGTTRYEKKMGDGCCCGLVP